MISVEYCQLLARYNRWMNERLYACAGELADGERKRDRGAFFGSIHRTFNHLMVGDRVWLGRLNGVPAPEGEMAPGIRSLDQELYADFDELRSERAKTDDALDTYVATLTETQLTGTLRYMRRGTENAFPVWQVLAHAFNHQTHHRGQITTLLMQAGRDPGVTDLLALLR